MRYTATYDAALGETCVELTSNCYTDALPLLSTIIFRKQEVDLKSQSLALACAILTARYCGEVFEFDGIKIGGDYAEAIRMVLRPGVNINGVDGHFRTISTGDVDIVCEKARADGHAPIANRLRDTVPLTRVDWSGDFVARSTRSSTNHAFGQMHTNAEFFADQATVSTALALLHGRDRVRNIYVECPSNDATDLKPIASSLSTVAIGLELLRGA
ncbi:hypothetical protein [Devosia sp. RR2S18]|uniref:hypothetical protein n=1 Tax=Devosia rhizosphaerae TaxID=3049774 RepID=UPI002540D722|nr:hypothetical protein [Devosia sp. RR2S18]WIJ24027.1 hypothetical protein QOV41_13475 [Devosia sp. RR2S18]